MKRPEVSAGKTENWSLLPSGVECKDEIYSAAQLSSSVNEKAKVAPEEEDENSSRLANLVEKPPLVVAPPSPVSPPGPQTATSKIFAPRTEEMSKGFLTFSEEEPGLTSEYPGLCNGCAGDVICVI